MWSADVLWFLVNNAAVKAALLLCGSGGFLAEEHDRN